MGTEELDELVEIASEVLTSTAPTIRVNREERGAPEVKERYRRLNMLHIQYVLTCLSEMREKARNIRSVMITSLYNAVSTISTYYGNLYQYLIDGKICTADGLDDLLYRTSQIVYGK